MSRPFIRNTGQRLMLFLLSISLVFAQTEFTEVARHEGQSSSARLAAAEIDGVPALAVEFQGTDDLHYYATAQAAPAAGLELTVTARVDGVTFGEPVFPEYEYFNDPSQGRIEVFVGDFTVLLPIQGHDVPQTKVTVTITGITCTSQLCLPPFTEILTAQLDLSGWPEIDVHSPAEVDTADDEQPAEMQPPAETPLPETARERGTGILPVNHETARERGTGILPMNHETARERGTGILPVNHGRDGHAALLAEALADWQTVDAADTGESTAAGWYFLLAILAGISINIMPCVLPVIPLIIMRLVSQAKEAPAKRAALGFSFCGGIVLFFAVFAVLSAVFKLTTGVGLDINSLYRNPAAVITLFLFIVFFALVLLDLLTLTLPGSVSSKQARDGGFAGSVSMGFFAGVLSTPCSGAILGAVLVWAQTQPLYISTTALILMGVGMALPYAVLVSVPKLLDYVPKPGTWMEIFKKTGGFLLLAIAVKFTLTALPKDRLINVLLYGVIFAYCVWMWGSWVSFQTLRSRKWLVRLISLAIAIGSGFWLLPAQEPSQIDWQEYDAALVRQSIADDRPVVIKFTADWCTNCKFVERQVYQQPRIAALVEQKEMLAIKADTTLASYPAAKDLNAVFSEAGSVPLTIVLDPQTQSIVKLRGIFEPQELRQIINERF